MYKKVIIFVVLFIHISSIFSHMCHKKEPASAPESTPPKKEEPASTPEPEPAVTPEPEPEPVSTPEPQPSITPEPEPVSTPEPEPSITPEPEPESVSTPETETPCESTPKEEEVTVPEEPKVVDKPKKTPVSTPKKVKTPKDYTKIQKKANKLYEDSMARSALEDYENVPSSGDTLIDTKPSHVMNQINDLGQMIQSEPKDEKEPSSIDTPSNDVMIINDGISFPYNNVSVFDDGGGKFVQIGGGVFHAVSEIECPIDDSVGIIMGGLINDTPDPVILNNGEFILQVTDLTIPGIGFDWKFRRSYRNQMTYNGPLGHNWDFNYNSRIKVITKDNVRDINFNKYQPVQNDKFIKIGSLLVSNGYSRSDIYGLQKDGHYSPPVGAYTKLVKNDDGTYLLKDKKGSKKLYDKKGFLIEIQDRNGNSMKFKRDSKNKLKEVIDTMGRSIKYRYNNLGRLVEVRDFINRSIRFKYDNVGNLVSVTSPSIINTLNKNDYPRGKTTKYTYSKGFEDNRLNHNLLTITEPNEVASNGKPSTINVYGTKNGSYDFDRVIKQTYGKGDIIYKYEEISKTPKGINQPKNRVTVIDRNGNKTIYEHNKIGNPLLIKEYTRGLRKEDPEFFKTQFEYNTDGERIKTIFPNGNITENVYEENSTRYMDGNLINHSRQDIIKEIIYEPIYNQISKEILSNIKSTIYFFDYQEGNNLGALASLVGLSKTKLKKILKKKGIRLGLGDINNDGVTNQISGNIIKIVYPKKDIIELKTYNKFGQEKSITDPEGNVTVLNYDSLGYLNEIVKSSVSLKFLYDKVGNIIKEIDGSGVETEYVLNNLNQPVQIIKGHLKQTTSFEYDYNNNIKKTSIGNSEIIYDYDILNNVIKESKKVSDNEVIETKYIYDANENLIKVIYPEGNYKETFYDERDKVLKFKNDCGGCDSGSPDTLYVYDKNGNVKEKINSDLIKTKYDYDSLERLVKIIDPLGNISEFNYDSFNNLIKTSRKDSSSVVLSVEEFFYDKMNRLNQVDKVLFIPKGVKTNREIGLKEKKLSKKYEYNKNNKRVKVIDYDGSETLFKYDSLDRLIAKIDGEGNQVEFDYDKNNNIIKLKNLEGEKLFEYDSLNQIVKVTDELGNKIRYNYDIKGNLILKIDAKGNKTHFYYDGLNRKIKQVEDLFLKNKENPDGKIITKYNYNKNSRISQIIDDNGNRTLFDYDDLDNLITKTFNDGAKIEFEYDKNNKLVTLLDANGSVTKFKYDTLGRLIQKDITRVEGVVGTTQQKFEYDGLSRLILAFDNNDPKNKNDDSTVTYSYDSLSRIIEEVQNGKVVSSLWEGDNTRLKLIYPNVRSVVYTYDTLNRIKTIKNDKSSTNIVEYSYLDSLNVLEKKFENGMSMKFDYDEIKRLISLQTFSKNNTLIKGFKYDYDKMDNKLYEIRVHDDNIGDAYAYDSVNRLIKFVRDTKNPKRVSKKINKKKSKKQYKNQVFYTFDGVGNRIPIKLDQYDSNGNLIQDDKFIYKYDFANRLREVIRKSDNKIISRFNFDAHKANQLMSGSGRRIQKNDVKFYYDDIHVILEEQKDSTIIEYVYGIWVDEVLTMYKGDEVYYYLNDGRTNVIGLTDLSGKLVESYTYDVYGMPSIKESKISNPYLFTGRRFDSETESYYFRHRNYKPLIGSFFQKDPLGEGHIYVNNNPVNWIDPMGLTMKRMFFIDAEIGLFGQVLHVGGTLYNDISDLVSQVSAGLRRPIDRDNGRCRDCLAELTLVGHSGGAGYFSFGPNDYAAADANGNVGFSPGVESALQSLRQFMCWNGIVTFRQCKAGRGTKGSAALKAMANILGVPVEAPTEDIKMVIGGGTFSSWNKEYPDAEARPNYGGGGGCFIEGTLVWTDKGLVPIENIKVNDKVLAWNEESDSIDYYKVIKLKRTERNDLQKIKVSENETLTCSNNHRFRVNEKEWIQAKDIKEKNLIYSNKKKSLITLIKNEVFNLDKPIKVYNFEVEKAHTYFIGEEGILVHNAK